MYYRFLCLVIDYVNSIAMVLGFTLSLRWFWYEIYTLTADSDSVETGKREFVRYLKGMRPRRVVKDSVNEDFIIDV